MSSPQAEFNAEFEQFLNDPGIQVRHPYKERITLGDIFVFPDLRPLETGASPSGETVGEIISARRLAETVSAGEVIVISGPEDSGKTALLKVLAKEFLRRGFYPVYVDWSGLASPGAEAVREAVRRLYGKQYTEESARLVRGAPAEKKALLLDNFRRIGDARSGELLKELSGEFMKTVVAAEAAAGAPGSGVTTYEIMEFGQALRDELVEKWTRLGDRGQGGTRASSRREKASGLVDTVTDRNLVPSYPLFILTMLQISDSEEPGIPSGSSYGHYYEYMITKSLARVAGKEDVEAYSRLLSRLAYEMFTRGSRAVARGEAVSLIGKHMSGLSRPSAAEEILDALFRSETLSEKGSSCEFRHDYIYHYFTALYLARNLDAEDAREEVRRLCLGLDNEEYAHIVLFLTHHSDDPMILEEVARAVERAVPAEGEDAPLDDLAEEIEKLIEEGKKLKEERAAYLSGAEGGLPEKKRNYTLENALLKIAAEILRKGRRSTDEETLSLLGKKLSELLKARAGAGKGPYAGGE